MLRVQVDINEVDISLTKIQGQIQKYNLNWETNDKILNTFTDEYRILTEKKKIQLKY